MHSMPADATNLHEQVSKFWHIDSSETYEQNKLMSVQKPFLPDNRLFAETALASLGRKLARQPDLHEKYKERTTQQRICS